MEKKNKKGAETFEEKGCGVDDPEYIERLSCQMCCLSFIRNGL